MKTQATINMLMQVRNICLAIQMFLIDALKRGLDRLEDAYTLSIEKFELALVALEAKADECA